MLDRLLDLADNDLWDLIAGRQEPRRRVGAAAARATARRVNGDAPSGMRQPMPTVGHA